MDLRFKKLVIARKRAGLTQKQFAEALKVSQPQVSGMEGGRLHSVPNEVIDFLLKNKFNLNAVFDNRISINQFIDICNGAQLPEGRCPNCAGKDEIIREKTEFIRSLQLNIDMLRKQLESNGERLGEAVAS